MGVIGGLLRLYEGLTRLAVAEALCVSRMECPKIRAFKCFMLPSNLLCSRGHRVVVKSHVRSTFASIMDWISFVWTPD